jgi:hypothetical protein
MASSDSLEPGSKTMARRFLQPVKQELEIVSIDDGRQIDPSDEHPRNADSPRLETREPGSNVKVESVLQPSKQDFGIASVHEGLQLD